MDDHGSIGERIARYRKRRGLSQEVLAGRVGRSKSWLTKVERGELVMDRISTLLLLANILKVEPGKLIGGVSLPPNGGGPTDPPRGVSAIRRAIFAKLDGDREPADLGALRATAEKASHLRTNGRDEATAMILPELLITARTAAARELPGSWSLLARVCQVILDLVREVGERDLALLIADRYVAAAEHSGDPLLIAASARHLGFALLDVGMLDAAGAVCSNAADASAPADATPVEGWSLWGSLLLAEAIIAARGQDSAAALLRDAWVAAEQVGPGRNDYWQAFGPANVGLHEVAVALESGDPVEALRIADGVDIDGLATNSRRAALCIDVAHAHALRRDDAATVLQLLEAERYAPDRVRHKVLARELVRVCLGRERRSRTPGLRALAERIGVAD